MSASSGFTKVSKNIWKNELIDIYDKAVLEFIIGWQFVEKKRLSSTYIAKGIVVSDRRVKRSLKNLKTIDYIRVADGSSHREGFVYAVAPVFIVQDSKVDNSKITSKWNNARRFESGTIVTNNTKKKRTVKVESCVIDTNIGVQDARMMVSITHTSKNTLTNCTNPKVVEDKKPDEMQSGNEPLVAQPVATEIDVEEIRTTWNFLFDKKCSGTEQQIEKIKNQLKSEQWNDYEIKHHKAALLQYWRALKEDKGGLLQRFRLEDFYTDESNKSFYLKVEEETKPNDAIKQQSA